MSSIYKLIRNQISAFSVLQKIYTASNKPSTCPKAISSNLSSLIRKAFPPNKNKQVLLQFEPLRPNHVDLAKPTSSNLPNRSFSTTSKRQQPSSSDDDVPQPFLPALMEFSQIRSWFKLNFVLYV